MLLIHRYSTPILTGPSLHSTALHFTSLHFTSLHFTSPTINNLHGTPRFNPLHCTTLHFTPLHFTSLHFTSLHQPLIPFTVHPDLTPFTALHFTSLQLKCRTLCCYYNVFRWFAFVVYLFGVWLYVYIICNITVQLE